MPLCVLFQLWKSSSRNFWTSHPEGQSSCVEETKPQLRRCIPEVKGLFPPEWGSSELISVAFMYLCHDSNLDAHPLKCNSFKKDNLKNNVILCGWLTGKYIRHTWQQTCLALNGLHCSRRNPESKTLSSSQSSKKMYKTKSLIFLKKFFFLCVYLCGYMWKARGQPWVLFCRLTLRWGLSLT